MQPRSRHIVVPRLEGCTTNPGAHRRTSVSATSPASAPRHMCRTAQSHTRGIATHAAADRARNRNTGTARDHDGSQCRAGRGDARARCWPRPRTRTQTPGEAEQAQALRIRDKRRSRVHAARAR
eukprot:Amastigsp_a2616_39.p4 type:complete len:124 gc:universal Amastigsp_a2616_39:900-529(-)